ncbi:anhydro-N-acetylmuramic acid kinase [Algoriphagus zhangzhouensis]|uniref:Anhydro-N-acetylmuramic acid kinase n=1 Tax=Algoriphagus zhangzhouensis TaxID=1073327 RepID=A0A1M7ZBF4_9BACT|nr:anhydro-N-acetylmuramic acid kinase [Algoriphagus zhangzhouensis]TDY46861.1 anhydro-N-acetylmuramic acid kinase [Algoriphagus zhangzhouensis]SHO62180.1 anhydro-N-acetylmuramic acid kinase [Algoriphagus zhangzhouensis]
MSPQKYQVIGLMSGTSGDGLDIAFCEFYKENSWSFQIIKAETVPFPSGLGEKLMNSHLLPALDLNLLDVEFGKWMGEQVNEFCNRHDYSPLAVCSHGHTVFHQPQKGLSLQIGNGWAIQSACGLKVINDFRMKDVQLGGQGAPLVPIGDQELFSDKDFCINLGGISNISMEYQGKRIAFDISPFNILLNPIAEKLGAPYDDQGIWASEGKVQTELLDQLNEVPFYQKSGAKSLGREDMENDFIPLIEHFEASEKDKLATLLEHYAFQIAKTIQEKSEKEKPSVLITGGGAYNLYFIERLDFHLQGKWNFSPAEKKLIEFKEALIFALLGLLRILGQDNCLASVTGASRNSSGGVIYE